MGTFEMVVAIVAIGCTVGVIHKWLDSRVKLRGSGELDAETKRHIEELEHRVQALEAIVTDRHYDLRRRFDDLERSLGR